jgi:hypothetical protein
MSRSGGIRPRLAGSNPSTPAEWLLLIHQLPTEPAYLRVKVARRLRRLGAVALKSSVYLLPAGEEEVEDFRWLRREIVDGGGEATLSRATFLDGKDDQEVRAMFQRDRDAEYEELAATARAAGAGEPTAEEVQRLRRRLDEIVARDRFDAPGRAAAEHALEALAAAVRGGRGEAPGVGRSERPSGATWVTRRNPRVDRLSSAWLIRRFIDPAARFELVDPADYEPGPGHLRFDMYAGEFGHEGDHCTFETLLARFGLDDPGLRRLGEVVHDIDCKESRFAHPETAGVAALVRGLVETQPEDAARIDAAMPLFESLYSSLRGLARS